MNRYFRLLTLVLCVLFSATLLAASLEARLDRARIAEGETVTLMIRVPGDTSGSPDVSALASDFEILSNSQNMQMSMINGRSSSTRGWQFVLAPRRSGKLTVPAIRVGSASTQPMTLEVLPAAQASATGPAPPVLLEADVESKQPYVQQKVIYTVRVLSRVPLRRPSVSDLQVADAIVEPLGPGTEYSTQRDGQQYRVMERRYAVFPQASGTLQIDGPTLSAELAEQSQGGNPRSRLFSGRDPFADIDRLFGRNSFPGGSSLFSQTRPLRLRAPNVELEVRAQPAGSPSPWLPAESLSLNEAWSPDPPVFRVGEPVTRTIAITAQGLSPAQLPDLTLRAPAGAKFYPDKPQTQVRVDGDTLIAQKLLPAALVPSQAGRVTLPEVRLEWWDTQSGKRQVARLAPREIQVEAAAAGTGAAGAVPLPSAKTAPAPDTSSVAEPSLVTAGPDEADAVGGYWRWLAALLGLAWLITVLLWWRGMRRKPAAPPSPAAMAPPVAAQPAAALARIEQACRADDAGAARTALLEWAALRWPEDPPRRLEMLGKRLGSDAEQILSDLDRRLYAAAEERWDGTAAWTGLAPALAKQADAPGRGGSGSALPPLYPNQA